MRSYEQTATPEPQSGLKPKLALAAVKGKKTLARAQFYDVHPNQITT
jgi:hypothetical protein